jgi:hypothetical protein
MHTAIMSAATACQRLQKELIFDVLVVRDHSSTPILPLGIPAKKASKDFSIITQNGGRSVVVFVCQAASLHGSWDAVDYDRDVLDGIITKLLPC